MEILLADQVSLRDSKSSGKMSIQTPSASDESGARAWTGIPTTTDQSTRVGGPGAARNNH